MSNPSKDRINDWIQNHEYELLEEWMAKSKSDREDVHTAFLVSFKNEAYQRFQSWAMEIASEILSNGNEDDPRIDR